ncbi:RuBisCO large subunit C-terminal-like domain-containing protein [Pectinatus frisingensis]|uniref:RuBisCO large subunit C-terminal-like domain-containing protein n=1 Tax=Pectinatus frisingensis TaxID=865 RepID=UPI0015F74DB9|nr:RuBisCO large subunit C-terminal-like domain-containing protein [Pectinatus frisingensis]
MHICNYPYGRIEDINNACVIASYIVFNSGMDRILRDAGNFAVGQTIGTWISVPGISEEMIQKYQGRVISVVSLDGDGSFFIRVAFPQINFASSFTMMLTALVGNDVSTALQMKLIDIEFYNGALNEYTGPKQKMKDLRQLVNVYDRPIVLNMIKPCAGFSPEEGAKLFLASASGGVDLIKDDEILGSPSYNAVVKRTKLYLQMAEKVYENTGKKVIYLPNITGTPNQINDNAKAVIECGAKACLINFVFSGIDTLKEICDKYGDKLFIMSHYAGAAVMNSPHSGIANSILLGLLPRLAGASSQMTMAPKISAYENIYDLYQIVQSQNMPMQHINPIITTVGGGITPINQEWFQQKLGKDIIIGIGGAIQGHPAGTTVGAKAAMRAVSASANNIPLDEAAIDCPELQSAIKLWRN